MSKDDMANAPKGVRLPFKRVKELKPFCPDCDSTLGGNNSLAFPYRCYQCNVYWESKITEETHLFYKRQIT